MSRSNKLGEQLKKIALQSVKTPQAKRDKISNKRGLVEGVDSDYQWKPVESIGARRVG